MSPRNALTNDQKRSICLYKLNNPLIKDKKIGKHFSKIFNVEKIPKSSLSRILSESETYLYNKKKQPMISAEEYIDCENDESIGDNLTDEDIIKYTHTEEIKE